MPRIFAATLCLFRHHFTPRVSPRFVRRYTALLLVCALLAPPTASARLLTSGAGGLTPSLAATKTFGSILSYIGDFLGVTQAQKERMPQVEGGAPEVVEPRLPLTKEERKAKVRQIELSVPGEITLQAGETRRLTATPLDRDGNSIHGLLAEWESDDPTVVTVTRDGQATARQPGETKLMASAGAKKIKVRVTVTPAAAATDAAADQVSADRRKDNAKSARFVRADWSGDARGARGQAKLIRASYAATPLQGSTPPPYGARLPDDETASLYSSANDVGAPAGRTEPGATTPPAAIPGTETPLSRNFRFSVPLLSLSGRGLGVGLALNYNSRVWHRSVDSTGTTRLTYDVDSGWPAPGFRLGYGHVEYQGAVAGLTLVDADGTRHELRRTGTSGGYTNYETVDGTFVRYRHNSTYYTGGEATYPDGTRVQYERANYANYTLGYPTEIKDRNGNYLTISAPARTEDGGGTGPRIGQITDTMGRYVKFHYDFVRTYCETTYDESGNPQTVCGKPYARDLVAITRPGYGEFGTDTQVARFYYETITPTPSGGFSVGVRAPSSVKVIRYVYFPATRSGYRYDYSPYGMIRRVTQLRGMTVSTTSLTQTGTVTSEGQTAATTAYNYPQAAINLADAPQFTERTDDWAGRTTAAAPTNLFSVDDVQGVSTVTAPNGTITETKTVVAPGAWNDGLVNETSIRYGANTLGRAVTTWETDAANRNPRPRQIAATNEAGETRTTAFTYTTYNNVAAVRELGFAGEELRRTETTYETRPDWINRNLLRLPTRIKVFGATGTLASQVDFTYDAQGGSLVERFGTIQHDPKYDPYTTELDPVTGANAYDPATNHRGNLTEVTRYTNAVNPSAGQTIADGKQYDTLGNVVDESSNCCQEKAYEYHEGYYYADVTAVIEGSAEQLRKSAVYDFNTGLVREVTDERGQITRYDYDSALRLFKTTRPDGGQTKVEYGETLHADPDPARMHSWVKTSTTLSKISQTSFVWTDSWQYFDGRGAPVRAFGRLSSDGRATVDTEYDLMGRPFRASNPYYSTQGAASPVNPAGGWTTSSYDALGRAEQVTLPDGNTISTDYAGTVTTATDQVGKQRRRIVDALGRLKRLDEPDVSGSLGTITSPTQATHYEYDTLDNLVHVTQGAQHRYFKYNSLGRMTHERQPEHDAPHAQADALTGNTQWSRKIAYNNFGRVTDITDPRGVVTRFTYDGLNRVKKISHSDSTPAVSYAYTDGLLTEVKTTVPAAAPKGETVKTRQQFSHDLMGRVAGQRQCVGDDCAADYAIGYTYSLTGQLLTQKRPGNSDAVSYAYDDAGRLQSVKEGTKTYAVGMTYAPHGGLLGETLGNGAVHTTSYNRRLQPESTGLTKDGNVLQRYEYKFGAVDAATGAIDATKNNGQIGRVDSFVGGTTAAHKQWEQRFTYDSLGRLDQAVEHRGDDGQLAWRADYDYDRYGNRLQLPAAQSQNLNLPYIAVTSSDISAQTNRFT